MNYQKIYNQIIEKRKIKEPECYVEVHHIVPASLGGSNNIDNLVKLTAREHFLCHYLLAKMYPVESISWRKMHLAFSIMSCNTLHQQRYINSRLYAACRQDFSVVMSVMNSGSGNSQYGTSWICNIELQENRKITKNEIIPDGWIKGRNRWKSLIKKQNKEKRRREKKEAREKLKEEQNTEKLKKENAYKWYNIFIISESKSLREFVKNSNYPYSVQALIQMFKTYIEGFSAVRGKKFKCGV